MNSDLGFEVNAQPEPDSSVPLVPSVGNDDLAAPAKWPPLSIGYTVAGQDAEITLALSMQSSRYAHLPGEASDEALACIRADRQSYRAALLQLARPGLSFSLATTLDADSMNGSPHALDAAPFASFIQQAYLYLDAHAAMKPASATAVDGTVQQIASAYGLTLGQLLAANQHQGYAALFGTTLLQVPALYAVVPGDTLAAIAARTTGVTVPMLATDNALVPLQAGVELIASAVVDANQDVTALPFDGTGLKVNTVRAVDGDTLQSLAKQVGIEITTLAALNADGPALWPAETLLQTGLATPVVPADDDTLAGFAAANKVTIEQLSAANSGTQTALVAGAVVSIPGALDTSELHQPCPAMESDTVCAIAQRLSLQSVDVVALNAGVSELLAVGEAIVDLASGEKIATVAGDTFESIIERFEGEGVTITLEALAASIEHQIGLVVPSSLWRGPPMRGDGGAGNPAGTLDGLAAAYGTDALTLASANAATLGLLAPDVKLPIGNPAIRTGRFDTLNSIVNRLMQQGAQTSVAGVAVALANVPGLIAPDSVVAPVPPPSAAGLMVKLTPKFATATFQLEMNVSLSLDPKVADPDTKEAPSSAVLVALPQPDSGRTLRFDDFAIAFESALPGVKVATSPKVNSDPTLADITFWCVNFEHSQGPRITYQFEGAEAGYFAVPPLSKSLVSGQVSVIPYASGTGLYGPPQMQMFQSIDQEGWLETFLRAVDQFHPAVCAASMDAGTQIAAHKTKMASALSHRVQPILSDKKGSPSHAQAAMYQALLAELSAACTGNVLVQIPVKTSGGGSDPTAAPRLCGDVTASSAAPTDASSAFNVSGGDVTLTDPGATASFLFSTASPAHYRSAHIEVNYTVTALQLPDPALTTDAASPATRLAFIKPLSGPRSAVGKIAVPIPLKSLPPPILLAVHTAQSVHLPHTVEDLLRWDLKFLQTQEIAEQDVPIFGVSFDDSAQSDTADVPDASPTALFAALAQFMAVYPVLQGDLASLQAANATTATETQLAAVRAFTQLVGSVADSLVSEGDATPATARTEAYAFQMQKEQDASGDLARLALTCVDPTTGVQTVNGLGIWPSVYATSDGTETLLSPSGVPAQGAAQAFYAYPKGIPENTALAQRLVFAWPEATPSKGAPSPTTPLQSAEPSEAQAFLFTGLHPLACQNASAGVSVVRNLSLLQGASTNQAFILRSPIRYSARADVPSVEAYSPIEIGLFPQKMAESLSGFFDTLLSAPPAPWQAKGALIARLTASYSYALDHGVDVVLPVAFFPEIECQPKAGGGWALESGAIARFVSTVEEWKATTQPSSSGASYRFEVLICSSQAPPRPLIHTTDLRYGPG
ncbi:LysM peptidoglycan-binding domain-containing protein [Paracidovorax valerianellae]|uniref:LysM peptidoglycan-binding domain-containing protein n=1 Tax=Paracidovorax valerianellae TaxID=187868 RepID=UPI002303DBD1|nr:LysM domain-containing protein [Paracidovorax valerianellae]MDA8446341.1 LysM peptidoglycan-binding domain-containing protein [Paracidovorax valerianellae]